MSETSSKRRTSARCTAAVDDVLGGVRSLTDGVIHGRDDAGDKHADVDNTGVGNGNRPRLREVGVTAPDRVAAPSRYGVDNVGTGLRKALYDVFR